MSPVENSFLDQQQSQQQQQPLDQQDLLDQLQYDLLAFDNLQFLPSEFEGGQGHQQSISFLPQHALSTPLPTPNYCTPPIHPHAEELEVRIHILLDIFCTDACCRRKRSIGTPNKAIFTVFLA